MSFLFLEVTMTITPEVLKFVHRIQIETAHLAKGLLAGIYRSAFKGQGLEFYDTREYQPGDEVRHIDWNQSSRSSHLYVKTFREERELNIILALDISASERFGSRQMLKSQLMAEIGAVIAFSALRNHDKVGLILYSDRIEKYLPPSQSARHILRIIREMLLHTPVGRGTDTAAALKFLGTLGIKPGICFLISDFLTQDFSNEAALIARKHDLIGIALTDPAEKSLPVTPLLTVQDLETGESRVVTMSSASSQKKLRELKQKSLDDNRKAMLRIGADFVEFQTDQPYLPILQKFFKLRAKHRVV